MGVTEREAEQAPVGQPKLTSLGGLGRKTLDVPIVLHLLTFGTLGAFPGGFGLRLRLSGATVENIQHI